MRVLCDINVLLALCYGQHPQHTAATNWLESIAVPSQVVICRQTQLGFMRLINNPTVMQADVHEGRAAWQIYDALMGDDRFVFCDEPPKIEDTLRSLTATRSIAPKLWGDAHLAAFAIAANFDLVTFDQGFKQFKNLRAIVLKPG